MKLSLLLTGILTLLAPFSAFTQNNQDSTATQTDTLTPLVMLRELSQGTLIVRLNSNNRKMKELERLTNSPAVTEKNKKRFQKLLETTREETRQESLDMMKAFDGNYNFSRVLFMYDTASLLLKNGQKSGFFINRELAVDPAIQLENDQWLMVYFRHESPATFILLNRQLDQVQRPFPIPKRPVFKPYEQGLFFSKDPLHKTWEIDETDTASGVTLFMSYNRKKQLKFFSVVINSWNNALMKSWKRAGGNEGMRE